MSNAEDRIKYDVVQIENLLYNITNECNNIEGELSDLESKCRQQEKLLALYRELAAYSAPSRIYASRLHGRQLFYGAQNELQELGEDAHWEEARKGGVE